MRGFVAVPLLVVALFANGVPAQTQQKETLAQFRARYVGQRILIRSTRCVGGQLGCQLYGLEEWQPVKQVGERYEPDPDYRGTEAGNINVSYATQEPTVIAIQLARRMMDTANGATAPSVNALGETVEPENPYVDVIVRFDDGQLAKITDFVSQLDGQHGDIELVPVRDEHARYLQGELPQVIGRALLADGDSRVFPIDSTTEDLVDPMSTKFPLEHVPNLEPLRITEARYNAEADRVILKLQLPDGRFGLVAAACDEGRGADVLARIAGGFLLQVPTGLTTQEIAAIQQHKIFRGMTLRAVELSWGRPEKVNDWGKGTRQLVFDDGHQLVYADADGLVTDWQSLH